MKPEIFLATDHAGLSLKNEIASWLVTLGYVVTDCGAMTENPEDDYPDYIAQAAAKVAQQPAQRKAIVFGGSGQGEAMVANRFRGVRATVYYGGPEAIITLSREHNDANVLSLGARFVDNQTAKKVVAQWLETNPAVADRHIRRIKKIDAITRPTNEMS